MSEDQTKNADALLQLMKRKGGVIGNDEIGDEEDRLELRETTLIKTRNYLLANTNYIYPINADYSRIGLTPEGYKAADKDIEKHEKKKEKEANKGHRFNWMQFIVSTLILIAGMFITWYISKC